MTYQRNTTEEWKIIHNARVREKRRLDKLAGIPPRCRKNRKREEYSVTKK